MLESADQPSGLPDDALASVEVAPKAETVHPAAAGEVAIPLADAEEYYVGMWSGLANYGCPYCLFATLDGNDAVEYHILSKIEAGDQRHPATKAK